MPKHHPLYWIIGEILRKKFSPRWWGEFIEEWERMENNAKDKHTISDPHLVTDRHEMHAGQCGV